MAEKAEVKVVLDTREAEAKAAKLRKKAERAERAVQRSEGGGLIDGRRASLGSRLRAKRAGAKKSGGGLKGKLLGKAKSFGGGGVGAFAGKAGAAGAVLIAAEIGRRGASIGAEGVGGLAPEFAKLAGAYGLDPGTIPGLQGDITLMADDMQRILSGDFIKEFLELERANVLPIISEFAGEGEDVGLGAVFGDVGKAFSRNARKDEAVERNEKRRLRRGQLQALKYGATDLAKKFTELLGGG